MLIRKSETIEAKKSVLLQFGQIYTLVFIFSSFFVREISGKIICERIYIKAHLTFQSKFFISAESGFRTTFWPREVPRIIRQYGFLKLENGKIDILLLDSKMWPSRLRMYLYLQCWYKSRQQRFLPENFFSICY